MTLTKTQSEALARMKPGKKYTAFDLGAAVQTMNSLKHKGFVSEVGWLLDQDQRHGRQFILGE